MFSVFFTTINVKYILNIKETSNLLDKLILDHLIQVSHLHNPHCSC